MENVKRRQGNLYVFVQSQRKHDEKPFGIDHYCLVNILERDKLMSHHDRDEARVELHTILA